MSAAVGAAITWWGHSSASVELGGMTVATDPLLVGRLFHLRRATPAPPPRATRADVVLVSHLHYDHLHLPSLDRFGPDVAVVVPRGAPAAVSGLRGRRLVEVEVGQRVEVDGLQVDVLAAHHDGRRTKLARGGPVPAVGYRFTDGRTSSWYPGDTGVRADFAAVEPVDLALVPIGGWGPTLGDEHLDPVEAADAVAQVGAARALAVHYGTFWPIAMRRLHPASHHRLFVTPPERFRRALADAAPGTLALTPAFGERVLLGDGR